MKYNAVHDHVVSIDLAFKDLIRQSHDFDIHAQDPVDRPIVAVGVDGRGSYRGGVGGGRSSDLGFRS